MVERTIPSGQEVDLERRRISVLTALALLGGATITITGCGGGGTGPSAPSPASAATPPPAPNPTPPSGEAVGQVSNDPRHSAVITAAQLSAGGDLNLDIQGAAEHSHIVALSANEVAAIRGGQRVQKQSSVERSHSHFVTFN